ncbi:MAG: HAD-IIIA family hydrolase, partial [Lentisphaerota bacterium]
PADLDKAVALCAAHYKEHYHDRTVLYPGVREGLEELHNAGYLLALITNKASVFCRSILEYFGIEKHFVLILGGGDTMHLKPHPEPLLTALERLKVAPWEAWMIGDHQTDLQAARHAHVLSILVSYGIGTAGSETPGKVVDSFSALVRFFT